MRFDPELGKFTRQHIYGEGMTDVLKSVGKAIFGKTLKSAAKKGAKKAVTTAATKTGEHVGKKAGDKIVQMLSKGSVAPSRKPPAKKVTFKTTPKKMTQQEINKRVNSILSGEKNYMIIKIKMKSFRNPEYLERYEDVVFDLEQALATPDWK